MAAGENRTLVSRYLAVDVIDQEIVVSYLPNARTTLGLSSREQRARSAGKSGLRRVTSTMSTDDGTVITARFLLSDSEQLKRVIAAMDRALDRMENERLTPKVVQQLLGITSAERSRWNKDGRLPKSGTGQFKRGRRVVQFYTHPADKILELASHPETIAAWRAEDTMRVRKSANKDSTA